MLMADHSCQEDKLLIIWENNVLRKRKTMEAIQKLNHYYSLRICILEEDVPNLEQHYTAAGRGKEVENPDALFDGIRIVLLPTVSDSLLADLAEGKIQNPIEMVVMEALCSGIPVKTLYKGGNLFPVVSEAALSYLNKRRQLLNFCGIEQISEDELYDTDMVQADQSKAGQIKKAVSKAGIPALSRKRRIITEEDILKLNREDRKTLELNQEDLITPLAEDTARELGMILHLSGKDTFHS